MQASQQQRGAAIVDLLQSICEERPLLLVLDDLQWADEDSAALLDIVLGRLPALGCLVLTTTLADPSYRPSNSTTITLRSFDVNEIGQLVESLATLHSAPWNEEFVAALHRSTGGSPLLALTFLRQAHEARLLIRGERYWETPSHERLLERLTEPVTLVGDYLANPQLRDLLRLFAHAGGPVPLSVCLSVFPEYRIKELLRVLEDRGVLAPVPLGYELRQDRVTDLQPADLPGLVPEERWNLAASLAQVKPPERRYLMMAAGLLTGDHPRPDVERAIAVEWLRLARTDGDGRTARRVIRTLCGNDARRATVSRYIRYLPWSARVPRGSGMVLAAAVIFFLLGLSRFLGDDAVARINILQMPIVAQPENALSPDLIVELLDESGRRVTRSGDSVLVKLLERWLRLKGVTTRTTQAGLVRFDNLVPEIADSARPGPIRLHVSTSLAPQLAVVSNIAQGDSLPRLRILLGRLAGQEVGSGGVVVVRPRQRVQGKLDLSYSAYWGAASVLLVAVPTWGRGPRDAWTVAALATPTIGSTISAPFDFTAPGVPGRYRLVLSFEAESDATDIASGTNWTIGHQVWDDGNDVGRWSEEMWEDALAHGRVSTQWLRPSGMHPHALAASWIELHVQGVAAMSP